MPNRLINETSPYLLQHAHNPVDWYPWGMEAFDKAQKEDKPIFLSIGYSTCHWCHVMAHESFEHPEVARLMNEAFISIKVDREERPDIDNVYMSACQMMTGSGGWPLSIIMAPDKKPFFAATYIPRENRFGLIGMLELLPSIRNLWVTQVSVALNLSDQITTMLQQTSQDVPGEELDGATLELTYAQLNKRFDEQNAGFGNAPKFPTPHNFLFLLRYWKRSGNERALDMVEKTLQTMRRGGIYDHVGFGFHRYSTDSKWLVPHYEKMLYDQALLAMAYIEAYQATGKEEYRIITQEIFTYVLRDMLSPDGGFYSAEDADSEGEEGKFYVWTLEEIQQALGKDDAVLAARVFNVEKDGKFIEGASEKRDGANILHLSKSLDDLASDLNLSGQDIVRRIESVRKKLFAYREKRVHPMKDDKVLADWNGLMIAALAKAAQAFGEYKYTEAAIRAAGFCLTNMRRQDGRLVHRYRDGQAGIDANLDDYAFLIWGLIELYEATFDVGYLKIALELNDDMLNHFCDNNSDGLYLTPDDGERLFVRKKEFQDGAVPSGNSVAMLNLLRLGRITANAKLEEEAARIGRALSSDVKQSPLAYTQLMVALDFGMGLSYEVVIVGNSEAEDTEAMVKVLRTLFIPNKVMLFKPGEQESPEIGQLAEFTQNQSSINGKATAYVCHNYGCELPTTDITRMLELLNVR